MALRTQQDVAGTGDRQDSGCKGLAWHLGNALHPTSTWDPALCWVRNLPVQFCWREVMVCCAWVQTNYFLLEITREKSFATHLRIFRGNTASSDENSVGPDKSSVRMCCGRPPTAATTCLGFWPKSSVGGADPTA